MADDRVALTEGLEQSRRGGGPPTGGKLARTPGPDSGCEEESSQAQTTRRLDAELQAGRTVRQPRAIQTGIKGSRSGRHATDWLESACQWRKSEESSTPAGLP